MNHDQMNDDTGAYLSENRNWGRWGPDDERGTINLVTPERIVAAAGMARSGRKVSLSRPFPTDAGPHNPQPALQYWNRTDIHHGGGHAGDWIGVYAHGVQVTHLDALCHVWDADGIYNGRGPDVLGFRGTTFGGIEAWRDGIFTRGVMLDVPRHRGVEFVEYDEPVHGAELEEILEKRGIELQPGDAVCVYSGREKWQAANPDKPYGRWVGPSGRHEYPGLHGSCNRFLREHDVSLLVWDMLDRQPDAYQSGIPFTVHGAIHAFGLAVLDNALLEPLADACLEEGRDDFLLLAVPLFLPGGTGSPVNPIAVF
ncbi:cyclase family protein [Sinosporangium album]|uniref:cyclase family protein n=1 Tax=Sinosporangium album TaxID=504805 RepID=UPI0015A09818|nr:cyclase family protein [Sinosporangium album]